MLVVADYAHGAECCTLFPTMHGVLGVRPPGMEVFHLPHGATEDHS